LLEEALTYVTPEQSRQTHEMNVAKGYFPEKTTHVDKDGVPVTFMSDFAKHNGIPLDKLLARIKEIEEGLGISMSDDNPVHRVN
jgi:hypothetical protein